MKFPGAGEFIAVVVLGPQKVLSVEVIIFGGSVWDVLWFKFLVLVKLMNIGISGDFWNKECQKLCEPLKRFIIF